MIYGIESFCWQTEDEKDIENLNCLSQIKLNHEMVDHIYGCIFGALIADSCGASITGSVNQDTIFNALKMEGCKITSKGELIMVVL